ncbi:MAG: sigma-70 family RNA polymerase sigma factor [Planctomycetaceae bacterium]|nr:sigma-70 family RNA polymerase sigma factor [Planctomycetaceae bacterium]
MTIKFLSSYDDFESDRNRRRAEFESAVLLLMAVLNFETIISHREYEKILKLINSFLMAYAMKLLASHPNRYELAEEIVQQWHLKMFTGGFSKYLQKQAGRSFTPYGLTALRNLCIDYFRQQQKKRAREQPLMEDKPAAYESNLCDEFAIDIEFEKCRSVLVTLPLHYRQTLHLVYWSELSRQEIADQFDVTTQCIANWKRRAIKMLREQMYDPDVEA